LTKFTPSIILSCSPFFLLSNFNGVLLFYFHTCVWSTSIIFTPPSSPFTLPCTAGSHCWIVLYFIFMSFFFFFFFFFFRCSFCVWEKAWYLSFSVWLILLNTVIYSLIHFPTNDIISFFFIHTTFSSSIHSWWVVLPYE
jgi:hypothetical protein